MAEESTRAVVSRLYDEVFNGGNLPVAEELVAKDAVDHAPDLFPGQAASGPDRVRAQVTWFRSAFPDATWTVDDMLAERDKVVLRATFRGTHDSEFLGLPATGRSVRMMELRGFRVDGGKIVELWGSPETFGLRHQLGDAPELGERGA